MADAIDDGGVNPVLDNLVQVSFAVIAELSRTAAEHDLSLTQLRVLAILRDRTPTMTALAEHLGLERSTVSGLIDRAARRGLVRRDAEPGDARAVRVGLSADGHRLAGELTAEIAVLVERHAARALGRRAAAARRVARSDPRIGACRAGQPMINGRSGRNGLDEGPLYPVGGPACHGQWADRPMS